MKDRLHNNPISGGILQIISTIVVIFMIIEIVFLMVQNSELRKQLASLTTQARPDPLQVGDRVGAFMVKTSTGVRMEVAFADSNKEHLLFIYSTTCPHCENTFPIWQNIAQHVLPTRTFVRGICVSPLNEMIRHGDKFRPNFEIDALDDTSFQRRYHVNGVPTTLLIQGDGIVKGIWVGELSAKEQARIDSLLGDFASPSRSQIQ